MNKKELIKARDEYIERIKAELLGPGSEFSIPDAEHELISSSPIMRYSVGVLFPQENVIKLNNDEVAISDEKEFLGNEFFNEEENEVADGNYQKAKADRTRHCYEKDETADEGLDEEIELATQYMPSSMGITFLARGNIDTVECTVNFALYRKAKISECVVPYKLSETKYRSVIDEKISDKLTYDHEKGTLRPKIEFSGKEAKDIITLLKESEIPKEELRKLISCILRLSHYMSKGYTRTPQTLEKYILDFKQGDYIEGKEIEFNEVKIKISALRAKVTNNVWNITVMLVNCLKEKARAENCIFQPKIRISNKDSKFNFLTNNSQTNFADLDLEEQTLELLYRNKKAYGTGIGTSVDWEVDKQGKGYVETNFFPEKEVPSVDFSLNGLDHSLSMRYFSDLDVTDKVLKIESLKRLIKSYKQWIIQQEEDAKLLDSKYRKVADNNVKECNKSYERMCAGITILSENETAYNAFLLANRAMFMQRIHINEQLKMSKDKADRYPDDPDITNWLHNIDYRNYDEHLSTWRPFQLAFLLLNIDSIVNDNSRDRKLVDLIWFPTGGGKTEAYLGLTAFTIFYRRLAHKGESGGTAVFMRYTLRLLAAQQFTRAATLICACEYIRKDCTKRKKYPVYDLGDEPITIGLWIGGTHTSNTNADAVEHLKELQKGLNLRWTKEKHNKFQVLKCPWCGTKLVKDDSKDHPIGKWGYASENGKHFYIFCPHEACDFKAKLPIQVIDEELYENAPTLLFSTVDKFAMLPWDGRSLNFFGTAENRNPELIIQDELHLISGALGTMVGLYEAAVDWLCTTKGIPPKIIASTATIRRAKEQCSVLYNREVSQFPAPGLNAEDSFFAREAPINYEKETYGRKYVGIMPSHKTKAMTEIRAIASLLQQINVMNYTDAAKDKFWTLTVYFNSLKDLGKTSTLVADDIKDFIGITAKRVFCPKRIIMGSDELTSRVTTTALNETLDKLEKKEYSRKNIEEKIYPSNILLATNMISVGIDVARLNVMLMVGQPKLTSEYIQASSRVGRSYPGVVFVQYDSTKSRDRSHYENFLSYHDSFYKFVEPTGATPFSKPARERALHAVIITILRQELGLFKDSEALCFNSTENYKNIEDKVEKFIVKRMEDIIARNSFTQRPETNDVLQEIHSIIQIWKSVADKCGEDDKLYFGKKFMMKSPTNSEKRLLKQFVSENEDDGYDEIAFNTPTSMRNVDSPVLGEILIWEE